MVAFKTIISSLITLMLVPKQAQFLTSSNPDYPNPQGTETIYLQGQFSGIDTNRATDERKFFFNESTLMYELYVDLEKGDYFYPYDKFKQKPFYWSISEMGKEDNMFTANGLSWYSRGDDDGFWYVNLSGKYHFSITYLVENYLNNSRVIWKEEYGSFIEFVKDEPDQIYFLLEKDDNFYTAYTHKDDSLIFEYGYGLGEQVKNTRNVKISGLETKTIVFLPYNSLYSEYAVVSKVDKDNNLINQTTDFNLENNSLFIDFNGSKSDDTTRKICSVLSKIEFGITDEKTADATYLYSLNTLEQPNAKTIIDEFDKMNDSEKQIVLDSTISYTDESRVYHENSKISEIINFIRKKSKRVFKTSIWTFLLPVFGIIGLSGIFVLFFSFKRKLS